MLDRPTALALEPGTRVTVASSEGPERDAIRCPAPFPHMEPAFRWTDAPAREHPLSWADVEGHVSIALDA